MNVLNIQRKVDFLVCVFVCLDSELEEVTRVCVAENVWNERIVAVNV
jgi:hypothetical protein